MLIFLFYRRQIQIMNQQFLTNFSILVIKTLEGQGSLCLGNESFIRSDIAMTRNHLESLFENFLFCVEIQANASEFRAPIEFEQPIALRHKLSNKYLGCSLEFEDEENDTTVRLELTDSRTFFRILPCFQYQTKISNKVKFNQDVYLATELNSTKLGFLTLRPAEQPPNMRALVGLNYRSKVVLHSYAEREADRKGYTFGQAVWLSHIQSGTFLTTLRPDANEEIAFEELQAEEPLQSINGLWLIDSVKAETGGPLHFGDSFRLKSLCTGRYLGIPKATKQKSYKQIDNEGVFSLLLEERPKDHSRFTFHSLKGQQSRVSRGDYLMFRHEESLEYLGARASDRRDGHGYLPVRNFTEFQDQDLFAMMALEEEAEEAIRFIFSIRRQFRSIKQELKLGKPLGRPKLREYRMLYINIRQELLKLIRLPELFLEVQEELGFTLPQFCEHILQLRARINREPEAEELLKLIYEILKILCKDFRENQNILYRHALTIVQDFCKNYGAEELLCEVFRNNYSLLCKAPNPAYEGCNLVQRMLKVVGNEGSDRGVSYWAKMGKLVSVLQVLSSFKAGRIDINQRLISSQLFQQNSFGKLFFEIRAINQRIRLMHPIQKRWIEIQQVRQSHLLVMLERLFGLFSQLCQNRNFLSKRYIHSYLSQQGKDSIQVIISYLNVKITRTFTNTLFSFITHCYVDSAPRIIRHRPLALITLHPHKKEDSRLSAEETIMSGRIKDALLDNAERSYATRPIEIPGGRLIGRTNAEPSLNGQQLAFLKDFLTEQVRENNWTPDLLRSMRILMQLECYSVPEMQEIKSLLNAALLRKTMPTPILEFAMLFFDEVGLHCQELQLKKINTFLQLHFHLKADITLAEIPSLLPRAAPLPMPLMPKQAGALSTGWETRRMLVETFNQQAKVLEGLYAGQELRASVLQLFLASRDSSFSVHSSIFKMLGKFYLPKLQMVRLLGRSIIIPEEETNTYEELFAIYKRMKYLVSISENWLNSEGESEEYVQFLAQLNRLSNYIFGDLIEGDLTRARLGALPDIKHQLLLTNFSLHLIVLQLLNKIFYLLEGRTRKEVPKKAKDIFQACFLFLEFFCRHSLHGVRQLVDHLYVIDRYRGLAQMGQMRILLTLYRQEPSLSKQVTSAFLESVIGKIVKEGKGNENCEYNPEYVQFLYVCCWSKKSVIKRNCQMINKILEKEATFRKFLFMETKDGKSYLSLEIVKFKTEPFQVPFIYHNEVLRLLAFLIRQLESAGNPLRNRLKQYVPAEYLMELLALPDIYSATGVVPELNFLIKKEIFPVLQLYFEKSDSLLRFHDSPALLDLLNGYLSIFTSQKEPKSIQVQNEYLMMPFLRKHKKQLETWRNNLRDYYLQEVRPLLQPFMVAIEKLPQKQKSKTYQKLAVLVEGIPSESLTHNHLEQEVVGMQLINIRWRNFVDDDEENSPQEKFAKKTVLDLLRSPRTYQIIEQERNELYRALQKEEDNFLAAVGRLLRMAVAEESTLDQEQEAFQSFYVTVESTAEYLAWRSRQSAGQEKKWQGKELVETLINYISRQSFNYNKPLARKSLFQTLRIFNELLREDKSDATLKCFYRIFDQNHSCFRFLACLRECIAETAFRQDPPTHIDQINLIMSEIYLCGEERKLEIDKEALRFIGLLCRHGPFPDLLRSQPYSPSVDFLEKIYSAFYFMIREQNSHQLKLTPASVDASEAILDCLNAFLDGCNASNQNYIVDNKFTDVVKAVLKLQKVHKLPNEVQTARRNRLLDEIIGFYASNGINLAEVFMQWTQLLDYRGVYLVNRFKYSVLRVLLQCTLANDRATNKVRILVPMELLKINLIWLYEDYMTSGKRYEENVILRGRDDWLQVVKQEKMQVFLMVGFYYFHLIELNGNGEKEGEQDEVEVTNDLEKQKEKIVKKFFSSINDRDRNAQRIRSLEKQPFADEMKMFYEKYYQAFQFFRSKTISIEANVYGNLVKLYFPKLPLCDEFTNEFKEQLIETAERISQDEKLKSLIEYENVAYQRIEGEHDFQVEIQSKSIVLGRLIKLMKNEEDVFLVVWVISCIIILLYLIDDYYIPNSSFSQSFASYLTPTYLLDIMLLFVSFCNLAMGFLILLNLIVKKIPFLSRYYGKRYEELSVKEKGNYSAYIASSIITRTLFDIYVIMFSVMSITHPLFAGFLTLYIVSRISLGKQIVQAIIQTWFSLLVAAGLLVVFNYIYSIYIYSASFTDDGGYGTTCQTLFKCLLMLVDQSLKSGSGFLGTAIGSDAFLNMVLNVKVVSEITYIIFAQKVIFQIFSGTIIDKFSQLREKSDSTKEDEESKCFICGQQRFQIDFQLQGFEEHIDKTHNKFNYIYYLFYLRRKAKSDYGIEERYIWDLHQRQNNSWIPDGTSLLKEKKELNSEEEKVAKEPEHEKYYEKKIQELKKVKQRIENYNNLLKDESAQ